MHTSGFQIRNEKTFVKVSQGGKPLGHDLLDRIDHPLEGGRLGDEGVCSQSLAFFSVFLEGGGCKDHYGDILESGIVLDFPQCFPSVHDRHVQVQENHATNGFGIRTVNTTGFGEVLKKFVAVSEEADLGRKADFRDSFF
jgi:hypothetical protein